MQKTLNRLVIIILSLWFVIFGIGTYLVQAATIAISLSTTTGTPGSSVTVIAPNGSFGAGEIVTVTYDTTTQTWTTTANPSGGLTATITIPASIAGSHYITATSANLSNTGNTTFTVTPSVSANPGVGVVGSSITISGLGFGASEAGISVTYDGSAAFSSTADSKGSWSSSFVIPASAYGARTVTATGPSNTATTTFSITPKISSNHASAAPGSSVTITGTGFGTSETGISVSYDGVAVVTTPPSISANLKGGWSASFVVPASPAGSHTIDASGSSTSLSNVSDITFTTSAGISASRTSAPPGSSITITGSGFSAGETGITVTYNGNPIASVTAADANGSWKANFVVPASPSGSHAIDAGSSSTPATTIADIAFTVTAGISTNRASAAPGSSITVTGSGFGIGETGITITYDGATTTSGISADANGGWKATLVIPASPAGAHTLDAGGATNAAASVTDLTFTVTSSIAINRPNAAPGSSVTVTGAGFNAGETGISVTYDDKTVAQGITANPAGGWSATFTVPPSASGSHSISAKGTITALTGLNDTGGGVTIEAGILLNPASSYVGASVEVSGSGFAANSLIKFTYDNKDIPSGGAITDASGSFSKAITIPLSIRGDHTIKASDEQNNNKSASFSMESTPPPTPNLLSPGDGARLGILGDITPTLKWSGVTDPSGVTYALQVDTDPDFSHPILDKKDIPGKSYILTSSESLPKGSYYWRVRAIDSASNESPWSQVWLLKSGLLSASTLVIIIVLIAGMAGGGVYYFMLRRRPRRGWEGVPSPEAEAPKPIPAQWRLIEPGETAGERPLPYRLALPQPAKGEKVLSTEDMARLKVIVDFAQSLPLAEPGYTSKWLLDLAQTSLGVEASTVVYKQLLDNELQIRYEPAWMRHPIFQDLATLLEGQPILQDLNAFVDAVNRCAAESTLLLQQIHSEAAAEIPADFLEKGGWEFISAIYSDSIRWFLGKSLHDPVERDYALKREAGTGEGAGTVDLWGEETTAFAECLIRAADENEALQFRTLHLKLRRTYRSSDIVKQLVDMMTQMAVQRDRLSSAFSQFDNFTR